MAHWAELDENNIVLRVLVCSNEQTPEENHAWLVENFGGTWLQTSYNTVMGQHTQGGTPFRGNFAGVGSFYYAEKDVFTIPKPFPSWVWSDELVGWVEPVEYPSDGKVYQWSEAAVNWELKE